MLIIGNAPIRALLKMSPYNKLLQLFDVQLKASLLALLCMQMVDFS